MRNIEEVNQEIRDLFYTETLLTKKELKELPNILKDNEHIFGLISGFHDGNTWIIACTDSRVIFLDKGLIYGLKQKEIALEKISSIEHKIGLLLGEIKITTSGNKVKIENCQKNVVKPFVDALNKQIDLKKTITNASTPQSSVNYSADEILKYKQLLDAGVITKEEFETKKKQLLGL